MAGKSRRVLIINLTRMGDLLQMTPFLNAFRQEFCDVEITLMVLKQFEDVCSGFPFVDKLEVFDAKDFLSRLGNREFSLVENYRALEKMLAGLRHKKFDTVINLSFSNHSALLTHLLSTTDVRGITMDDQGNRLLKHPWVNHFYNMVDNREINLFNYVDFIRKIGGATRTSPMSFGVSASARTFAETFYTTQDISEADRVIGMQPGASTENKRWPAESFGVLAAKLIEDEAKIVLFGGRGERELGEHVRGAMGLPPDRIRKHFFDMIGNTSVDQLASLVARCDLLVTNDTGTMHMATAVGTRVVELSLGPVYFPETGPYGEGHIVIQTDMPCAPCEFYVQCKNPRCRESISVAQVLRVVQMVRDGRLDREQQLEDSSNWNGVQLYRGVFDEEGMLEFHPVIRKALRRVDLIKLLYREMWKLVLDERPGEVDSLRVSQKIHGQFTMNGIPVKLNEENGVFGALGELASQGMEISQRLVEWSEKIAENIPAIKTAGRILHAIDEQIELKGLTHRVCHPLTFMFRQGKENLQEGDIGLLSRSTLRLYETLFREATLMNRGLQETVAYLGKTS